MKDQYRKVSVHTSNLLAKSIFQHYIMLVKDSFHVTIFFHIYWKFQGAFQSGLLLIIIQIIETRDRKRFISECRGRCSQFQRLSACKKTKFQANNILKTGKTEGAAYSF